MLFYKPKRDYFLLGIVKEDGVINGGFYPASKSSKSTHLIISVDNLEKHIAVVKKAGGKILGKPMDIPGIGKFVMLTDLERNRVGMLEPASM